jgi:hypothetical protein
MCKARGVCGRLDDDGLPGSVVPILVDGIVAGTAVHSVVGGCTLLVHSNRQRSSPGLSSGRTDEDEDDGRWVVHDLDAL